LLTLQLGERRQTGGAISSEAKRVATQARKMRRSKSSASKPLKCFGRSVSTCP
jgi:hypothetical protein